MPINVPLAGGPTKQRLIEMAYAKCGTAGYVFGRTPEEVSDALSELDAMMNEHPFSALGYVSGPNGSIASEQSGIPNDCTAAVAGSLAQRLAPNLGKTLSPEAQASIANSRAYLLAKVATIPTMPYARHTPRGLGAKWLATVDPFLDDDDDDNGMDDTTDEDDITTTGSTVLNSNQVTIASPTGIAIGMVISGAGIPTISYVTGINGSVITISNNATATASGVSLLFT